jgi:translocation and assembly module TamA
LLTLQRRLEQSRYFASASVQPDLARAHNGLVPIEVLVAPGKRNEYRLAALYGTDSGLGGSLWYERRWLNSRGHKLDIDAERTQRLAAYSLMYRIPLIGADDLTYNIGAAYRSETSVTATSRNMRFFVNETRLWRGFVRTLGVQFIRGDFDIGATHGNSTLFFPEAALAQRRADNFSFPRRGRLLTLVVRAAHEGWGADTGFAQVRADGKWIRGLGARQRLILRGSLGATTVNNFGKLPPELRFFAGGAHSIRGFGYQEIGPRNAAGEVIGGRNLTVGSAELERYFAKSWGAAVFVDGGDAFDSSTFTLRAGAGIGLRWKSPLGVVRVDFARSVAGANRNHTLVQVSIGPDL